MEMSAILHTYFCWYVCGHTGILNKIPLASLAAIYLLMIGYKLAPVKDFSIFIKQGKYQFFHLL